MIVLARCNSDAERRRASYSHDTHVVGGMAMSRQAWLPRGMASLPGLAQVCFQFVS